MEFLRLHDIKTKRLYFIWYETSGRALKCGCIDGCLFYSVFDKKFNEPFNEYNLKESDYFFNLKKSISRDNGNFGRSLFVSDKHILDSHPMMKSHYSIEYYNYKLNSFNESNLLYYSKDNVSTDSSNCSYKKFNEEKILNPISRSNTMKRKSSFNLNSISGSNRTLNRDSGTIKRVNSRLLRNKTQSEMSLNKKKTSNKNLLVSIYTLKRSITHHSY